jgi:hypothetical protein
MIQKYPEIVAKAKANEYVNDVVGRARKLEKGEVRDTFIQQALEKLPTEEMKQKAISELKYRRVEWSGQPATGFSIRGLSTKKIR